MFKDITLAAHPCIIHTSKNSNMVVIWVNIQNFQNGTKAKTVINRSFNFGRHITTVRGTFMNPSIPQCKNCWKWGYTTFACHLHRAKCKKCGGLHKLEHHRDIAWCCKANFKTNSPRLETKAGEPCPHDFKCLNCKESHLADDPKCPLDTQI